MNTTIRVKCMIFFLMGVGIICSQEDSLQETLPVPDGWIAVREETWVHLLGEPSGYFRKAYELLLVEDYKVASAIIKKAASLINIEASRAKKRETKAALNSSLKELKNITKEMARGKRIRLTDMEAVFARAEYALAAHQYQKAIEFRKKREFLFVGFSLSSVCKHIRNGWSWSHEPLPGDDHSVLKEAQQLSAILKEGEEISEKALDEVIKKLGIGVQNLRNKASPGVKK